jgi:DNA-directed RNA polymerase subunit N (RpoN/RPB10)
MYPFVVCYTCGSPIGHLHDAFREMQARKMAEHIKEIHKKVGIDDGSQFLVNFASLLPESSADLSDVFDALNIFPECCRAHILTGVSMKDLLV